MGKRSAYLDLKKRQQEEINDFPIAYAFNAKQLEEALERLGATKEECVTVFDHGDIVRRDNVKPLLAMLKRHTEELKNALKDEEFAYEAFVYEMDNHEYAINWTGDEDVLSCFSLTPETLKEMGLEEAYSRARKAHMQHARDWGMI